MSKQIKVRIKYKRNAMERSHIPPELILDILTKFLKNNKSKRIHYKSINFKLTEWTNKPSLNVMLNEVSI